MKKRTKVMIGVAAGVVVLLLLAGALLLQPPAPYDFLRGATLEEMSADRIQFLTTFPPSPASAPVLIDGATRRYRSLLSAEEVQKSASGELSANGWNASMTIIIKNETHWRYDRGKYESIRIAPAEGGGCDVTLFTQTSALDRVQAWFWNLTHR